MGILKQGLGLGLDGNCSARVELELEQNLFSAICDVAMTPLLFLAKLPLQKLKRLLIDHSFKSLFDFILYIILLKTLRVGHF